MKCLVHVVEKLDEKHLQEKLVRCIVNLQNDTENSIRTNATIFLGRIAPKLKDGVRQRVLCSSFAKAMRDNFMHCRVAGLKAATACLTLLDHGQLTTKVMPQVCSLLLDRTSEVRELAIKFLELALKMMAAQHSVLCTAEKKAALASAAAGESPMKGSSAASEKDASSWSSSWASLSMTLEKVTTGGANTLLNTSISVENAGSSSSSSSVAPSAAAGPGSVSGSSAGRQKGKETVSADTAVAEKAVSTVSRVVMTEGWGDDGGFDDWGDTDADGGGAGSGSGGWGADDDLDLDTVEDIPSTRMNSSSSVPSSPYKTPNIPLVSKPFNEKKTVAPVIPTASKTVKPGPSLRLAMNEDGDNWDDF